MSSLERPKAQRFVQRAKAMILAPGATWDEINVEPATVRGLFTGYVMVLAAIGPVCRTIGSLVFGDKALGITYHPGVVSVLVGAIVNYAMDLAGIYVLGLIIEALAPTFGGRKDRIQAFKVAAYSGTAGWVASVFYLIPASGGIAIIGEIYSLYLLYRGLPKLMQTSPDKALGYTGLVAVVYVVLLILITALTASFAALV